MQACAAPRTPGAAFKVWGCAQGTPSAGRPAALVDARPAHPFSFDWTGRRTLAAVLRACYAAYASVACRGVGPTVIKLAESELLLELVYDSGSRSKPP